MLTTTANKITGIKKPNLHKILISPSPIKRVLNAYILNKHYGCKKLTHDEYRDKIIKYLLAEGLKNYKIPLPPVISRNIIKLKEMIV